MRELDKSLGTYGIGRKAAAAIDTTINSVVYALFARQQTADPGLVVVSGADEAIEGVVEGKYRTGENVNIRRDAIVEIPLGGTVVRTAAADDGYVKSGALGVGIAWDGVAPCGGQIVNPGTWVTGDVVAVDLSKRPAGAASTSAADTHGGSSTLVVDEEEITLDTGGTTTTSSANLIRANAVIEGFTYRWTTAMATATDYIIGKNGGDTDGLLTTNTTFTLGATGVGNGALISTFNATAAKVLITTTGTPSAGKIRVVLYQRVFTAPTS